jgi:hypothetical protein
MTMERFRQVFPSIPGHVFRAGHAEQYRIAAMKSLKVGKRGEAARRLAQAVRLCPWLFLTNWRAAGTAVGILMPTGLRLHLNRMFYMKNFKQQ